MNTSMGSKTLAGCFFAMTLLVGLGCSSTGSSSSAAGGADGSGGAGGASDGAGGASGSNKVSCSYPAKSECGALTFTGAPAAEVARDQCVQDGGTVVEQCPTMDLLGCCTQMTLETCYYTGGTTKTAAELETDCGNGSGEWSTSP